MYGPPQYDCDDMRCASSNCDCCPKYDECYPKIAELEDKFDRDRKAKRERELEEQE